MAAKQLLFSEAARQKILEGVEILARAVKITLGPRGVQIIDGRGTTPVEQLIPINAVEVVGTTVGCGDAFIAAFLNSWWRGDQTSHDLAVAVTAGAALGAAATAWLRPLPDDAYA